MQEMPLYYLCCCLVAFSLYLPIPYAFCMSFVNLCGYLTVCLCVILLILTLLHNCIEYQLSVISMDISHRAVFSQMSSPCVCVYCTQKTFYNTCTLHMCVHFTLCTLNCLCTQVCTLNCLCTLVSLYLFPKLANSQFS